MTTTLEAVTTGSMLNQMFLENTGRSMGDSGDFYGRNFSRNASRDLPAEPKVTMDSYGDVTLSTFHHLNDRLEYLPELDAEFQEFVNASDNPYLVDMEDWAKAYMEREEIRSWALGYEKAETFNTYNFDTALDQTLQFVTVPDRANDRMLVILQVHGGCDARAGYTRPRVFVSSTYEAESWSYDMDKFSLYCQGGGDGDPHAWNYDSGEFITYEGSFTRDPWEGAAHPRTNIKTDAGYAMTCPTCGGDLHAEAPEAD